MSRPRLLHDAQGYSLVELIVIVLILGIIAAIAFPSFLSQRAAGHRAAVTTDVRNAGNVVAHAALGAPAMPDGLLLPGEVLTPDAALRPVRITAVSDGVELAYDVDEAGRVFCVAGTHERLAAAPVAVFDSSQGGLADDCSFDARFGFVASEPIPTTFAAQFRDGVAYITRQDENGGFTTRQWGRELLVNAQDISRGSFELNGASATADGGGWGIVVHGSHDEDGQFNGYTVQLDHGYGGGAFVLRRWVDGREQHTPVTVVTAPEGFDWGAPHDVRVDVDGARVALVVDGNQVLESDQLRRTQGAFGVRTWSGTYLDVESSQVTVDPR